MSKRMTVVFHNEALYTTLKMEAARRHQPASELVAEAVREWLERHEKVDRPSGTEMAGVKQQAKGGRSWDEAASRPRIEPGEALLQAVKAMGDPEVPAPAERSVAREHDEHLYTR